MYNSAQSPHSRYSNGSPVPGEISNWRDEQRAWRNTAILFDQSHHMPELIVRGPDARNLLNGIGVNSFANLKPGRAKQFVGCNEHGQLIGDCILHTYEDGSFQLISGTPLLNWVQYQAQKQGANVEFEIDEPTHANRTGRRNNFRFGMDGPNAGAIFAEVIEGPMPHIPFFNTAQVTIAGCPVLALRHGMAGHQGVELSGRYEDGAKVRAALLQAGRKWELRQGGMRAYYCANIESGWISYPLPAIFTDPDLAEYRRWLPANSFETRMQIGGSFVSSNIEDYYLNPFELGYDRIVSFDHDFIGRAALERMKEQPQRRKVTLEWNSEDVEDIQASILRPGVPYRYMELPIADYSFPHRDEIRNSDGEIVGVSARCVYSANEMSVLSLAVVDADQAEPGTQVLVTWGEPNGGSRKPQIDRHRQKVVRATVAPAPYAKTAQSLKRAELGAKSSA
jgi:vanillate/3-O-methylgallate O-demethylase